MVSVHLTWSHSDVPSFVTRIARAAFRPADLTALATFVIMLLIACFAGWQSQVLQEQRQQADVIKEANLVRARLDGNITATIQLVRGLVATIATEPDMDQARFSHLVESLFEGDSLLRSLAAAPDLVVTRVYPLAGNEKVLGLDYRQHAEQRDAVLQAIEKRRMVMAGPLELVQGGQAFVTRFPVYRTDANGRETSLWGVLSATIDVQTLYARSRLAAAEKAIDFAISARTEAGPVAAPFYGNPEVLERDPVKLDIALPSGNWQIAAIPQGGWVGVSGRALGIGFGLALLALVVSVPILLNGRLMLERQGTLEALRAREAELDTLSRRLGLALDTSEIGVWEYDLETNGLVWDTRMNRMFGMPNDGKARTPADWRRALHPDDAERAIREFQRALNVTGRYHSEYRIRAADGTVKNIRAMGTVYDTPGRSTKLVGVNWDVSQDVALNENLRLANRLSEARNAELEQAKAAIEHNSLHDSLTGLPNRRYLDDVLARWSDQGQTKLALLHIDLDRFKQINDTLGHAAGDAMLRHAAQVLRANVRSGDFVARIGGDEFVVVSLSDVEDTSLAQLADRIITKMREPVFFDGHECRCGVSVGIAKAGDADCDAPQVLVNADIALYRAKSRGRNRFEFFTNALQADVVRTKMLADEILNGLEQHQFIPYFQPQFDAHTREVVGVEALARWQHPTKGLLPPSHFLDVAEDLNVVATIDRMIMEQSLTLLAKWRNGGLGIPKIAVNVSSRRLREDQLIPSLRQLDIQPGMMSFELLESIFLDETDDTVMWNIEELKDLGIDIEIDDFGTGYASIISLMKLKPKRLKIDRQLVMPIVTSQAQRRLVESIVEIGRSMDIEAVGEGVETMAHADILRDLGCSVLQGYAFAPPMSAADLEAFVARRGWIVAG
ncbi:EAL domain-containing protein [Devosia sp.]|uniref:bifunctional diguanylate cyclase/phosphodiesterase n=1 Tax=Devosia sp. TaxID=1871048 RepID=UPI003A8CFC73